MGDEVGRHRAAMAPKGRRLAHGRGAWRGRGVEALGRTALRRNVTRADLVVRSLIAHGNGIGGIERRACSFALAAATTALLFSVSFATGRAVPIAPSDLGELETPGLRGAAAGAMFLTSVTGATDGKLGAAATAPLEAHRIDASTPFTFAPRDIAAWHRELLVDHVADRHDNDQTERADVVQRFERPSPGRMRTAGWSSPR